MEGLLVLVPLVLVIVGVLLLTKVNIRKILGIAALTIGVISGIIILYMAYAMFSGGLMLH